MNTQGPIGIQWDWVGQVYPGFSWFSQETLHESPAKKMKGEANQAWGSWVGQKLDSQGDVQESRNGWFWRQGWMFQLVDEALSLLPSLPSSNSSLIYLLNRYLPRTFFPLSFVLGIRERDKWLLDQEFVEEVRLLPSTFSNHNHVSHIHQS